MTTTSAIANFRAQFPALERWTWLDCAAVPPGCIPVLRTLRATLDQWESGDFWLGDWEDAAEATRGLFARLIHADAQDVALVDSLATAAGTVANSIPPGRLVVGAEEFRSNLFPWLQLAERGFTVHEVPPSHGRSLSTDAVVDAIDERTVLVAVSAVQSFDGARIHVDEVARKCRAVGARLFVNLTQCAGVLDVDATALQADYVAAHGYKWMLCPRGAGWLYVRRDHIQSIRPLAPNWKSTDAGFGAIYGGPFELSNDARRADVSLAWLSWIGARAALQLLLDTGVPNIERQALHLAGELRSGLEASGWTVMAADAPSQMLSVQTSDPTGTLERLQGARVKAGARGNSIRLGFHGFNDARDVAKALDAFGAAG